MTVLFAMLLASIVTLNDFPEYIIAGTPLKLTFTVRQQGTTPLAGLHPSVSAVAGGLTAKSRTVSGKAAGEYETTITLPQPGQWTITIASGGDDGTLVLPPLKVITPGSPAPDYRFSPGTRGLRLFSSKGCVGCHRQIEVNPAKTVDAKLDLTGKRYPQDYLKRFLADPTIKSQDMPNLKLKTDEIDALAAFINKLASKDAR